MDGHNPRPTLHHRLLQPDMSKAYLEDLIWDDAVDGRGVSCSSLRLNRSGRHMAVDRSATRTTRPSYRRQVLAVDYCQVDPRTEAAATSLRPLYGRRRHPIRPASGLADLQRSCRKFRRVLVAASSPRRWIFFAARV